jgi:hypothetical protein
MSRPLNTFPPPWDFGNDDKSMLSASGKYRTVYGDLTEVGKGGPLQGALYLQNIKTGKKAKIFELAGGPPVWDKKQDIVAVPIWWRHFFFGTYQKLLIINLKANEFIIYKKRFKVLHLSTLEGNTLQGSNKREVLNFDLSANKVMFKRAFKLP